MNPEIDRGSVVVIVGGSQSGVGLCRAIAAAGERPLALPSSDAALLAHGTDEDVDLLVTDLGRGGSGSLALLERIVDGGLLPGVPSLHVVANPVIRERVRGACSDRASAVLGTPVDPAEFRTRVVLGAEIGRLRRELARGSVRDASTGAFAESFAFVRLREEFSRARRHETPLSFVLFALDRLAPVRERYGFGCVRRIFRRFAELARSELRAEDVLARWGVHGFAAILGGTADCGAAHAAEKIRARTEALTLAVPDGRIGVSVSVGVSSHDGRGALAGPEALAAAAEVALGTALRRGGNRVVVDEEFRTRVRRLALVADPDLELLDVHEVLARVDFDVVRADGEAALLETLRRRRPDVLIVDLERVATAEPASLVERIRAMYPGAPVPIVGLASPPGPVIERAVRVGVDRFITKPFSVAVLASVARELLERHRRAKPPASSV